MRIEFDISDELLKTYDSLKGELEKKKKEFLTMQKELEKQFEELQRIRGEITSCLRLAFDENHRLRKKAGIKDGDGGLD